GSDRNIEQHINLNFLVKLNKTAAESFGTLYGEHYIFSEGREDVKDERSGRLSIRMRAEMVSTDKETVQPILHENLNMTKVCAKVVPKLLTPDQKEKQFLAQEQIPVLDHPPCSPDLAPCDLFLFPKIKSVLKGTCFESVSEVKKRTIEVVRQLSKEDLLHCFDQWKT
uniref:Uncharacterized protein n=1 Tax=Lates calcarifer TaxID=8187 RepID=A0A4W6BQX3_LATCA